MYEAILVLCGHLGKVGVTESCKQLYGPSVLMISGIRPLAHQQMENQDPSIMYLIGILWF